MCISILDLLKNSSCTVTRGVFNENDVWILKDIQQEIVAYQVIQEGNSPFEGVYCLLEKNSFPLDFGQNLPIRALLMGALF